MLSPLSKTLAIGSGNIIPMKTRCTADSLKLINY